MSGKTTLPAPGISIPNDASIPKMAAPMGELPEYLPFCWRCGYVNSEFACCVVDQFATPKMLLEVRSRIDQDATSQVKGIYGNRWCAERGINHLPGLIHHSSETSYVVE